MLRGYIDIAITRSNIDSTFLYFGGGSFSLEALSQTSLMEYEPLSLPFSLYSIEECRMGDMNDFYILMNKDIIFQISDAISGIGIYQLINIYMPHEEDYSEVLSLYQDADVIGGLNLFLD